VVDHRRVARGLDRASDRVTPHTPKNLQNNTKLARSLYWEGWHWLWFERWRWWWRFYEVERCGWI